MTRETGGLDGGSAITRILLVLSCILAVLVCYLYVDIWCALLEELEDAGEAIVDRMESKKAEVDAMLRLLDAKLDLLQLALQAKPVEASPMPATNRKQEDDKAKEFAEAGGRHEQIKALVVAGLDPLAIAQRTGMRLDEVRLVISLLASQCKSTT